MKPAKVNTLAACIAAIGFSPIIYAADNTPTVILDTVTVKGTRNKRPLQKSLSPNNRNPNTDFRLFSFQIFTDFTQIPP